MAKSEPAQPKYFHQTLDLSGQHRYDENFIQRLDDDLLSLGYMTKIILPDARLKSKSSKSPEYENLSYSNPKMSVKEFLNSRRDYPSLLFVATHPTHQETIRILFNNVGSTYIYKEEDLPRDLLSPLAGHTIIVSSSDPARSFSMAQYLKTRLSTSPIFGIRVLTLLMIIGAAWAFIELITFVSHKQGYLSYTKISSEPGLDLVAFLIGVALLLIGLRLPKPGLRIEPREPKLIPFLKSLVSGKFTNNPIVVLIVAILGTVIGGILLGYVNRWLGLGIG